VDSKFTSSDLGEAGWGWDVHDLQKEEDERREKVLSALGLRVVPSGDDIRFGNDDVLGELPETVRKIKESISISK